MNNVVRETQNPHRRYATCRRCGIEWQISTQLTIPLGGYICPQCAQKGKKT